MGASPRAARRDQGAHRHPRDDAPPARDPDEAAFLKETGQEGPFIEVELPGWREWNAYRGTPPEERTGPPRNAAWFAAQDRARGYLK